MNRQQRRAYEKTSGKRAHATDVAVGVLTGHIAPGYYQSFVNFMAYDLRGTDDGRGGKGHLAVHIPMLASANIVTARNLVVRQFLELPPVVEWLWMLDDDMTFEPDTLERLLAVADAKERPIVGGLCFSLEKGEAQAITPTMYGINSSNQMVRYHDYPQDEVIPVAATGAACMLVHRSVFETIAADERYGPPWPWFAEQVYGDQWGDTLSEDVTFCLRAGSCGIPVFVDTSIKLGHVKTTTIDEPTYLANLAAPEEPAPTYVVIPVKGQIHYTEDLLDQLIDQGGFEHVFVYDNAADTPDCLKVDGTWASGNGITVIPAAGKTITEMWNLGIKEARNRSPRCNIAILNNDLELGENFLAEMAAGLRAHPSIAAVSGNYDNRVFPEKVQAVKGICAGRYDGTGGFAGFAFMIRSELADALGGTVFDEQFRVWFQDNDLCATLDKIGATYGIVRDAHVKHLDGGGRTSTVDGVNLKPEYAGIAQQDRDRFVKKWGQG